MTIRSGRSHQLFARHLRVGALVLATIVVATGCTADGRQTGSGSPTNAAPSFSSTYTPPAAKAFAPLTGVEIKPGSLDHPALAMKIPDDTYGARPQININSADILYEELVEGGITRYVAMFHSKVPKVVGPTRSIRPMDPAIIAPLKGIVAYSGGQGVFRRMMRATPVKNVTEGSSYFSRDASRNAPDNLVLRAADLVNSEKGKIKPPPQQFSYASSFGESSAQTQGKAVHQVNVTMSSSSKRGWTYDAASKTWLRSQDGSADRQSDGARVSTTNLIIVRVNVDFAKYASLHGSPPYTHLFGSGEVWVSNGGKFVKGTWSKGTNVTSILTFNGADGFPIRLAPGRTWIELVPLGSDGGGYSFQ